MIFLTTRSQGVHDVLSDALLSSNGSPQGCVLSPVLFVLHTNVCQSQFTGWLILKFADNSVVVSHLKSDDPDYDPVVSHIINWYKSSF